MYHYLIQATPHLFVRVKTELTLLFSLRDGKEYLYGRRSAIEKMLSDTAFHVSNFYLPSNSTSIFTVYHTQLVLLFLIRQFNCYLHGGASKTRK